MSHVFPRLVDVDLPRVARARGAVMWDEAGKAYLDAAGGALVVGVGHGDDAIVNALAEQARRVAFAHGTQFTSEALESYCAELAALLPLHGARIYPVSGGSEAVETALKLARAYHLARGEESRRIVLARLGSYHGNTRGALDASGRDTLRRPYRPWLGLTQHVPAAYEYRCTLEEHPEGCGEHHGRLLEEAIVRAGPENVCCFIAEPVVGAALGAVVPPDDYWPAIERVCRSYGVLLVVDEVMTGFGRTGSWFGCDHWDVRPDILAAGKGASSGYWPLGFAACRDDIYEAVKSTGFVHGFTFSHSVVGASVGRAVLRRLREASLVDASRHKGERLRKELDGALAEHPFVGEVRGLGLMIGVELVADRASKKPFPRRARVTERVLSAARERGLLLYPAAGGADGTDGDALMIGPPFVIGDDQLGEVVARLVDALGTLERLRA